MFQRMPPGGRAARSAPVRVVRAGDVLADGRILVQLVCSAEGASIGYTAEPGPGASRRLYSGEIMVMPPACIRAKANRNGFL